MEFITRFDAEPEFWQFLSGLKFQDVVTELVQNELDAEAKHTRMALAPKVLLARGTVNQLMATAGSGFLTCVVQVNLYLPSAFVSVLRIMD
jgi:hypothetical protein